MNPYLVVGIVAGIAIVLERVLLWRSGQLLKSRIVAIAMDRIMQQCKEHEISIEAAMRCLKADLEHGPRHLLEESCWDALVSGHKGTEQCQE